MRGRPSGVRDGRRLAAGCAYGISSVLKFETIEFMKFSRMITMRIDFQSDAFSPSNRQMDSSASLTSGGGFAIERTSTRCCFLIDFTAV